MPQIKITFEDGGSATYEDVPDHVTPEEVYQRANTQFAGRKITGLSRTAAAKAAQAAVEKPAEVKRPDGAERVGRLQMQSNDLTAAFLRQGIGAVAGVARFLGPAAAQFSERAMEFGEQIDQKAKQQRATLSAKYGQPSLDQTIADNLQPGAVLANLMTLPGQGYEAGRRAVDAGESDANVAKAAALGTIGAGASVAMGAMSSPVRSLLARAGMAAAGSVGVNAATTRATQELMQTAEGKRAFDYTNEQLIQDAVLGGVFPVGHKAKVAKPKKKANVPDADAIVKQSIPAPEPVQAPPSAMESIRKSLAPEAETPAVVPVDPFVQLREQAIAAGDYQRAAKADEAIRLRQEAMEQEVARQTALDNSAAERARQEAAPTMTEQMRAEQEAKAAAEIQASINKTQELNIRGSQMEIDATPHGDVPAQFGSTLEHGRVDENGIPIRADLSIEAQQLENPLQRNLWGDELPGEQGTLPGRSMTSSLDSLPDGPVKAAAMEALGAPKGWKRSGPKGYGRKQSGAINLDLFSDVVKVIRKVISGGTFDGMSLAVVKHPETPGFELQTPEGEQVAQLILQKAGDNVEVSRVHVDPNYRGTGAANFLYDVANNLGNDIQRSSDQTAAGAAMWDRWEQTGKAVNGIRPRVNRESGQLNIGEISDTLAKSRERMGAMLKRILPERSDKDVVLGSALRDDSFVAQPMSADEIVAKSLTEEPGSLFKNWQSGGVSAGDKANSTLLRELGRWVNWSRSIQDKRHRELVIPAERDISRLTGDEQIALADLLMAEDRNNTRMTEQQLRAGGYSDKTVGAWNKLRSLLDRGYDEISKVNEKLGRPIPDKREAYFSAMQSGPYALSVWDVRDPDRRLGYLRTETIAEMNNAKAWIAENMPNADKKRMEVVDSRDGRRGTPIDVSTGYRDLLKVFEGTEMAKELQGVIEAHKGEQAFRDRNFFKHFEEKHGVRFFLGDRPWLNEKQNAQQALRAQIRYLTELNRWVAIQPMLENANSVLSNKDLAVKQPEQIAIGRALVDQHLGTTENLLKLVEDSVEKTLDAGFSKVGSGVERGMLRRFSNDLKAFTHAIQLAGSVSYQIGTPLQLLLSGGAFHRLLTSSGVDHNPLVTIGAALRDSAYATKVRVGRDVGVNWSSGEKQFANDGLRYLEDNGWINHNYVDPYAKLGESKIKAGVLNAAAQITAFPDKMSRIVAFYSYAHHMKQGAPHMSNMEIFRKAAELVDKAAAPLSQDNRPIAFDKLGAVGAAAFVYKGPVAQSWNNLIEFAQHGKRTGDWTPMAVALGSMYLMGGAFGLPGVSEAEQVIQGIGNLAEKAGAPKLAYAMKHNLSINNFLLNHGDAVSTYGAVSAITGLDLGSKFKSDSVDLEQPFGPAFGLAGQAVESIADLAVNRDKDAVLQSLHRMGTPVTKGLMENYVDEFEGVVPSDIRDPRNTTFARDAKDRAARNFGMRTIKESRLKNTEYAQREATRLRQQMASKAITAGVRAAVRGTDGFNAAAQEYIQNSGQDGLDGFVNAVNRGIVDSQLTPVQKAAATVRTRQNVLDFKRLQELQNANQY